MRGHQHDLDVVIASFVLNIFAFGDRFKNEVFFKSLGGRFGGVAAQEVELLDDLFVGETAAAQFENSALKFAVLLRSQEAFRKVPIGVGEELRGDLTASALLLLTSSSGAVRSINMLNKLKHI